MKVNMGIPQFTGGVLAYVGTPPEIINRPLVFMAILTGQPVFPWEIRTA